MGQRVNIQYSVELDNLEREVSRLFNNAIAELRNMKTPQYVSSILGHEGLTRIDSLRQSLAKIDIMLGDVQNIVEGYVRFSAGPQPVEEEISIEDLSGKIATFKEMVNENSNQEPDLQHESA